MDSYGWLTEEQMELLREEAWTREFEWNATLEENPLLYYKKFWRTEP